MRNLEVRELGRMSYRDALALQKQLADSRKRGEICDQLLLLEHPHTITMGRNGNMDNILASAQVLERTGIHFETTDRGGDVTYHGPGQLVGYPIVDLRDWRRDVVGYLRTLETVLIDTLAEFGIHGERIAGLTGVWVDGRKIAAIGVHISRWVTSHGFALNVSTDLKYFQYIVPCGLAKPVASMEQFGVTAGLDQVARSLAVHFGRVFECEIATEICAYD